MIKKVFTITVLLLLIGCSNNDNQIELTISAAASMIDALNEVKSEFENENPNIKLLINTGGSGALQQQIAQGAPVDLFLSAAEDKFTLLENEGLIDDSYKTNLVSNKLVLIGLTGSNMMNGFADLTNPSVESISIGTPESVPAGMYAKETLQSLGIYQEIAEKIVPAKDVRQVLTYVETENVQAGIVYQSDAIQSSEVQIVATANESDHTPIHYPVGLIKQSKHKEEAIKLYEFLVDEWALDVFESYGFTPIVGDAT